MASIREQILAHLKTRFEAITAGVDGFTETWEVVTREPLSAQPTIVKGQAAIGIYELPERSAPNIGVTNKTLRLVLEFHYKLDDAELASMELNRLLLDVQRTMLSDTTSGGLSLNVTEDGNELDIDGPGDGLVVGAAVFNVLYRHKTGDPSLAA